MTEHQRIRRKLWLKVAVAVAGSAPTPARETITSWANHALAEFDRQFKDPQA